MKNILLFGRECERGVIFDPRQKNRCCITNYCAIELKFGSSVPEIPSHNTLGVVFYQPHFQPPPTPSE
jgi:hypothetical protein